MVVRKRARAILVPLLLYAVSAGVVGYFVHHAHSGARGLEARRQFKIQAFQIGQDFEALRTERTEWERRIALLRADQIDRDLLEERARQLLGYVHKNDLVVVTGR
jgi:cell division protein FtsB